MGITFLWNIFHASIILIFLLIGMGSAFMTADPKASGDMIAKTLILTWSALVVLSLYAIASLLKAA